MTDVSSDEQISQFMAVTGSADPTQAASYLEMSGGNLETAVGFYMEHNQSGHSMAGGMGTTTDGGMAPLAAGMDENAIRAPDATRTMRLMDDVDMGPHPAFQLMNAMMQEQLTQSAFGAPMPSDTRDVVNAAATDHSNDDDDDDLEGKENESDDEDDEVEIIERTSLPHAPARLSDMFAPPVHLTHKAGGFQGARSVAKDSRRWLLVNLQRDSEFSCHALNRDVWRDELVENLVREGFILWQSMDIAPEGRTYAERYQVREYPHLAIIDPRTARLMWRKEGWTQENPMTAEWFAEIAMDFCSRNSFDRPPVAPRPPNAPQPPSRPSKRPVYEMSEDEQLRAAMQASLEQPDENMEDEVEIIEASQNKAEVLKGDEADESEEKPRSLTEELTSLDIGAEPEAGARIQFRMPDGKRKIRKFNPSDSVIVVYAFVAQSDSEASGGREFNLMAGYPPRDLSSEMENTIEKCKLAGEAITVRWK